VINVVERTEPSLQRHGSREDKHWWDWQEEASALPIPEQLDIMVTDGCNAKCAFCVQEATFKPSLTSDQIFLEALRRHFREFHELGGRRVVITGGEPLLGLPRVISVLNELSGYELEVKALYTNGERLLRSSGDDGRSTVAEALANARLECVNLSVHHHDHQINNRIFGLPCKPRTEAIAEHLNACGLPFRFNLALQRGGVETYEDVVRYADCAFALGAQDVYVRELFNFGFSNPKCESDRNPICFSQNHRISAMRIIAQMRTRGAFELVRVQREAYRNKVEHEFIHLASGRRVYVSWLEIGTEHDDGLPYLVLMPDGGLYRGWLGGADEIGSVRVSRRKEMTPNCFTVR
jgi:molybdenum cofactor biosynthesis enzyme MoaA